MKRWKGSRLGLAAAVALEKQRFWQLRPFMKLRAGDDATYMRERDRALQNRRTRAMLAIHLHRALQIPVKEAAAWVVKSERERASVLRMITHVRYPTKARK